MADLCEFKCLDCDFFTQRPKDLLFHAKRHSRCARLELGYVNKAVTKPVLHECKLCGMSLLCYSDAIRTHVNNHHQDVTTFKEYKTLPEFSGAKAEVNNKLGTFVPMIIKKERDSEGRLICKAFENAATFKCPDCGLVIYRNTKFLEHVTKAHGKKLGISAGDSFIEERVLHPCRVCGKPLLADKNRIISHVSTTHGISNLGYQRLPDFDGDMKDEDEDTYEDGAASDEDIIKGVDGTLFCKEPLNACLFQCPVCPKVMPSTYKFLRHVHRKHEDQFSKSTSVTSHQYFARKVLHVCRVCRQGLICDKSSLRTHFKGAHGFTSTNFEDYLQLPPVEVDEMIDDEQIDEDAATEDDIIVGRDGKTLFCMKPINACLYQCPECPKILPSNYKFFRHLQKKHPVEKNVVWAQHNFARKVLHVCRVCKRGIKCDKAYLKTHIADHHQGYYKLDQYGLLPEVDIDEMVDEEALKEELIGPLPIETDEKGRQICR